MNTHRELALKNLKAFSSFLLPFPSHSHPTELPFPNKCPLISCVFFFCSTFGDSLSLIKVAYMNMDRGYLLNYGKFNYGYIMEENDSLFPTNQ